MNDSNLSIDLIGEDNWALICKTKKNGCCRPPNLFGEWYYHGENKTLVPTKGTGESPYRDRTVRGEVRLHNRGNIHAGMYCCVVPDSDDNCGIKQTLCINLGKYIVRFRFSKGSE